MSRRALTIIEVPRQGRFETGKKPMLLACCVYADRLAIERRVLIQREVNCKQSGKSCPFAAPFPDDRVSRHAKDPWKCLVESPWRKAFFAAQPVQKCMLRAYNTNVPR